MGFNLEQITGMKAVNLIKILDKAINDSSLAGEKVPLVTIDLTIGGLHLKSWWAETYYFKFLSWNDVIASRGETIMEAVHQMQNQILRGDYDVEGSSNSNSDVG